MVQGDKTQLNTIGSWWEAGEGSRLPCNINDSLTLSGLFMQFSPVEI